ncbi:hypothetical protein BGZ61DRAFT_446844 [Ilyonectria robusta]|uniref:uncharacterized protein n=1 Tax=Ilyonectria robusta TaxID=1079257 RepID=UPI001E8DFF64|nr:uncharacterized protein BGZ61DRAFT_446844 [Ilyonectria robusta]KAH8729693.1 hypothetical protein BGZ61DRAFT_446844 [Ilyonectria robusta]
MKLYQILTLTSGVGAVWPAFLGSSACNIESKANVPGVLAVAAKASREFATETLPHAIDQSTKWVVANPFSCGGAVVGLLSMAAPGLVATPLLGAMGFGAEGIIASSYAATIQSAFGSIISPSLFATLQSAGAGGYGVAKVYSAIQVSGAITSSVVAWVKSKSGLKAVESSPRAAQASYFNLNTDNFVLTDGSIIVGLVAAVGLGILIASQRRRVKGGT